MLHNNINKMEQDGKIQKSVFLIYTHFTETDNINHLSKCSVLKMHNINIQKIKYRNINIYFIHIKYSQHVIVVGLGLPSSLLLPFSSTLSLSFFITLTFLTTAFLPLKTLISHNFGFLNFVLFFSVGGI